jgi:hypothetical protein
MSKEINMTTIYLLSYLVQYYHIMKIKDPIYNIHNN